MENQITLTLAEVGAAIGIWAEYILDIDLITPYLKTDSAFNLSRSNYLKILAQTGNNVNGYLGIHEDKLVLIWVPVNNTEAKEIITSTLLASVLTKLEQEVYLIDIKTVTTTNSIELSADLELNQKDTFKSTHSLSSKDAVSANSAYSRIKNWGESCLDWAYFCIQQNTGIVQVFSIPMVDLIGEFSNANIHNIKMLWGLYWCPLTNCSIPDLLLVADEEQASNHITSDTIELGIQEVTDLLRPCPPFCRKTTGFSLLP